MVLAGRQGTTWAERESWRGLPCKRLEGTAFAVIAVAGLYLAIRLLLLHRFPYFLDEATYAHLTEAAARSRKDLFISLLIGREPLQTWLGIPWVKLGVSPLTALRLESATCGLITAAVVGLIGCRLGSTRTGLIAGFLFVILPFDLVNDGVGIAEPLVTLIMAAALLLQIEFARTLEIRLAVVLGLVFAAAILTKSNALPAIALTPASLLCFDWSPRQRARRIRTWLIGVGIAAIMAIGAELILRSSSLYKTYLAARKIHTTGTVRSLSDVLADPFADWSSSWSAYGPALRGYATIPLLVAAAAGLGVALRRNPRLAALLATWTVAPLAVALAFVPFPYARHVMYLVPPIVVLMAYALAELARYLERSVSFRASLVATAAVGVVLLVPALRFDAAVLADPGRAHYPGTDDGQYVTGSTAGSVWPAVAASLRQRTGRRPVTVALSLDAAALWYLLPASRFAFVTIGFPHSSDAELAVSAGTADALVIPGVGGTARRFVSIKTFRRPRAGAAVTLYAR